jgi:hypothetical protein
MTKQPDIPPSGTIDLYWADSVDRHKTRERAFEVVTPERTYALEAPTDRETHAWIAAITAALEAVKKERETAPKGLHQLNEKKQGWLFRLNMFRQWKRVWCVMRGGVIMYYKAQGQTTPSGKLALYRAELSEHDPEHIEFAFEIRTFTDQKTHTLVLRAQSDEEMHSWLNSLIKQKLAIEQTIDLLTV